MLDLSRMLYMSMYSAKDWKKEVVAGFSNRKFLAEVSANTPMYTKSVCGLSWGRYNKILRIRNFSHYSLGGQTYEEAKAYFNFIVKTGRFYETNLCLQTPKGL